MTPEQHIAAAEVALVRSDEYRDEGEPFEAKLEVLTAIAHALIATAVEGGVPHATVAATQP